jgi:RNA polymerase-binding transcription factor
MPVKKASTKKSKKPSAKKAAKAARGSVNKSKRSPARKTGGKAAASKATKRSSAKRTTQTKATGAKKRAKSSKAKSSISKSTKSRTSTRKVSSKKMPTKVSAGAKTRRSTSSSSKQSAKPSAATKRPAALHASVLTGPLRGFEPYKTKRGEPYMSEEQLEHFRKILLAWKRELMEEVDRTMLHMKDDAANFPDPNDRATQESEFGLELRTRDRERKLLKKIDSALQRIDDGSYGYCEETGDEIGLRRLEARPVATLCVEAQERRELAERQYRDREDYYR